MMSSHLVPTNTAGCRSGGQANKDLYQMQQKAAEPTLTNQSVDFGRKAPQTPKTVLRQQTPQVIPKSPDQTEMDLRKKQLEDLVGSLESELTQKLF